MRPCISRQARRFRQTCSAMASFQLISPMPVYTLEAGATVTVEAIDPDTGAAVTGVTVTDFTITAWNDDTTLQLIDSVPLLAAEPLV